mmetsp:Transcript_15112/g.32820  ORF Transcript_15112/g.32820 Transcript_15112/m.32820 type:complete len:232 (+) Transcript_15112:1-696(+)
MIPWDAISFLILWFEYIGFSKSAAGLIMFGCAVGAAGGAIFGGWLGDKAARWSPNRGRIAMAQFSLLLSVPLSFLFLNLIPRKETSGVLFVIFGFLMAFFCNWVGPGCNEVVISEVVLPAHRTVAFSVDRLFEGTSSAMGSIFVGGVAQSFGYNYGHPIPISELADAEKEANMEAIANAMTLCCIIFWSISFIIYLLIPRFYPHDRDRVLSTPRPSAYSLGYSPILVQDSI